MQMETHGQQISYLRRIVHLKMLDMLSVSRLFLLLLLFFKLQDGIYVIFS